MSKESDRVIAGFMRLSEIDRQEILREINNYIKQDLQKQRTLKESFEKRAGLDLGPLGSGKCPCCGK